jgi:hypothetical protein
MAQGEQEEKALTLAEAHKEFAIKSNGRVWELLGKEERSQIEDDELLYAVHASNYHWLKVGTSIHHQRGEYMIAKVCLNLGVPERALHHAQRCLALTQQHAGEMQDFDVAFAYEIVARAQAMNGNHAEARSYHDLARRAGDEIENPEDKSIFDGDFESGDWFGLV